jgi:hypothetical protein
METVDLWRSMYDGNEETSTWFMQEVETMVEQFIITEDNNIITLMHSTVMYCLLRPYMAAGSTMADSEQNDAIVAHVPRMTTGCHDPEEDAWSTRSIYHSARSVPTTSTTSRPPAQAPTYLAVPLEEGQRQHKEADHAPPGQPRPKPVQKVAEEA